MKGLFLQSLEELAHDDVECLVPCLRGLELLDYYRRVLAWVEVAEAHDIPPAQLPLVMLFAVAGLEFPEGFPGQLRDTTSEMVALPEESVTRDVLLRAVGLDHIASKLAAVTETDECVRLLQTMSGTTIDWRPLLSALKPDAPLVDTLKGCSPAAFGDCVSSARDVSLDLAREFVGAVGGIEAVLQRIRNHDPWIWKLEISSSKGEEVGVARFLYVSESEQGEARGRAVETGQLLLRTLPDISRVDVEATLPGGGTLEIDGISHGSSGLLRQYGHNAGAIARNQDRLRLAHTVFGATETARLSKADKLITAANDLIHDFGNAFVLSRVTSGKARKLLDRCARLNARSRRIPPRLEVSPLTDHSPIEANDPLSAIISDVCGNVLPRLGKPDEYLALSAFVNETVLGKGHPKGERTTVEALGLQGCPTCPVRTIRCAFGYQCCSHGAIRRYGLQEKNHKFCSQWWVRGGPC